MWKVNLHVSFITVPSCLEKIKKYVYKNLTKMLMCFCCCNVAELTWKWYCWGYRLFSNVIRAFEYHIWKRNVECVSYDVSDSATWLKNNGTWGGGIKHEGAVNITGQSWCGTWIGGCEVAVHKGKNHKTVCVCVYHGKIHTWMKQTSVEIMK